MYRLRRTAALFGKRWERKIWFSARAGELIQITFNHQLLQEFIPLPWYVFPTHHSFSYLVTSGRWLLRRDSDHVTLRWLMSQHIHLSLSLFCPLCRTFPFKILFLTKRNGPNLNHWQILSKRMCMTLYRNEICKRNGSACDTKATEHQVKREGSVF